MNNQSTYKRVKINWWLAIIFGGAYVFMIYTYINELNSPNPIINITWLIIITILEISIFTLFGRFKVIINDDYAIFRLGIQFLKIPILMIKSVSIVKWNLWDVSIRKWNLWGKIEKYKFDTVWQAVNIEMQNGKIYQISIENAQKIKKEIKKRMITTNNNKTSVA